MKLEIEVNRIIALSLGIANGIEKIHQIGISHRDLKTKNVFCLFNFLFLLLLLLFLFFFFILNFSFFFENE